MSDHLGVGIHAANGPDGDVELGDEHEDDEDDAEPGTVDSTECLEGKFLDRVTLDGPCPAEANVAQAYGQPCEECRKSGQSKEPGDCNERQLRWCRRSGGPLTDGVPGSSDVGVSNNTKSKDSDDGEQRATGFVDIGEDFGRVTCLGEGRQCARSGINAGETDGKDGDTDRGINKV